MERRAERRSSREERERVSIRRKGRRVEMGGVEWNGVGGKERA